MSLSKKNIADKLALEMDITHVQALQLTNDFFDQIRSALAAGEQVKLSGFGNFTVRKKAARPGRNPKTGEAVEIAARKVVGFKAGPKLKQQTQTGKF